MDKKEIQKGLDNLFENPKCELEFKNTYELLVAVILSAQCTDARVNKVTKKFFSVYQNVESLANADEKQVENIIQSCGLFHNKAHNLVSAAKKIVQIHGGVVPNTFEELTALDGVGRKTANVILSVGYNKNAIAVDTHVFRVSNRLAIAPSSNVLECEKKLQMNFNESIWTKLHYQLVLFGRYICTAKKPNCNKCPFRDNCKKGEGGKYVS